MKKATVLLLMAVFSSWGWDDSIVRKRKSTSNEDSQKVLTFKIDDEKFNRQLLQERAEGIKDGCFLGYTIGTVVTGTLSFFALMIALNNNS